MDDLVYHGSLVAFHKNQLDRRADDMPLNDTEAGWNKLAVPLDRVIEANNTSNIGLKKRDVQLARREDIMDGRVCANRVKIDELTAKVTLGILDASVEYLHLSFRSTTRRSS